MYIYKKKNDASKHWLTAKTKVAQSSIKKIQNYFERVLLYYSSRAYAANGDTMTYV